MPAKSCALLLAVFATAFDVTAASSCLWGCAECDQGNDFGDCTRCDAGYRLEGGACYYEDASDSCGELTDEEAEDYYGKILVGSVIGTIITIITTITGSLPVCCGVMKQGPLVPVAVVIGAVAGISMFIPMITGKVVIDSVVSDICHGDDCNCSEETERDLKDALSALGIFVAYLHGFGFLVLIFGGVTICMSCCMCCPCCGPLQQAKLQQQQGGPARAQAVQGQVVGQPACS